MSAAEVLRGAWGGDPERKQAAIATVRATLAGCANVSLDPFFRLAAPDRADGISNVYCAAFGTGDPEELQARAGLTSDLLRLISALMCACDAYEIAPAARDLPAAALEEIPVGVDNDAIVRSYMVALLDRIADIRGSDGHGLAPEHLVLVRKLRSLYAEVEVDAAAFRALRRSAMSARDAATKELETAVLHFVESTAWPLAGLTAELPELVSTLVYTLCSLLSPYQPSASDVAIQEASNAQFRAINERRAAEPQFEVEPELRRIRESPEFAAISDPDFVSRRMQRERAAAEAFVPFTVDLLIGVFRKA